MEFITDIFSLDKSSSVTFNLVGTRLPNNPNLFFSFKAKYEANDTKKFLNSGKSASLTKTGYC